MHEEANRAAAGRRVSIRGWPDFLRRSPSAAVHAARTAPGRVWRAAFVVAIASSFLAYTGAFGSGAAPFPRRWLFWCLAIGAGAGIAEPLAASRWLRERHPDPFAFAAILTAAVAVPTSVAVWLLEAGFFQSWHVRLGVLPVFFLPVLAVTAGLVAISVLMERSADRPREHPAPEHAAAAPQASLVRRACSTGYRPNCAAPISSPCRPRTTTCASIPRAAPS